MVSPPAIHQPQPSDGDRSELRPLDYNLAALCEHIQMEGFNSGSFSDVIVQAMGSTYHLHRLIISRSSYFRNMLHGPWKEASAPTLVLHIDDANVNSEAIAVALAYLYGHHPKLNDSNTFRVLAAASFLDLQDLCAICTDFIISELWTANFLAYQVFAESQDYGIHGERVRNACWGYLCQSGTMELREVLPKLSCQTLHALLTSDELWVLNEEKRFELALYTLLAKGASSEADHPGQEISSSETEVSAFDSSARKGKNLVKNTHDNQLIESDFQRMNIENNLEAAQNILVELADCVVDFQTDSSCSKSVQTRQTTCTQPMLDSRYPRNSATFKSLSDSNTTITSHSSVDVQSTGIGSSEAVEGPSGGSSYYSDTWLPKGHSRKCSSASSTNVTSNEWERCSAPPLWGGRIVGRRQVKSAKNFYMRSEEYDAFVNIFEGGSLLYCNMSFEALLNARKQLEELGYPCKAVNDGLWLQMLLCQRVQEIGADTCKKCSLTSSACACRHHNGYLPMGYYRQDHERNENTGGVGSVYVTDAQSEESGLYGPVRVHVRGPIDGLAGIGRGTTFVSAAPWPPTRYVFSRVPYGLGNRNCQQSLANGESEARVDFNPDLSGDGLTALVGLSQGSNVGHVPSEQVGRVYELDMQNRLEGDSILPSASSIPLQMLEPQEHSLGLESESSEGSFISLDMKTPLSHFPPFRFGVEFEDVHRLANGQVKHSSEVFYAGSLWKVSVQAFNDDDLQRRRTLGLFLHRRKAEATDPLKKVHMYVDSREKVTARYQLICPSKREVMVFGSFKQAGTLLPKAPKGWGWRISLLFDELADLLQAGSLRVSAVVQLV